jgi:hypothetical protein
MRKPDYARIAIRIVSKIIKVIKKEVIAKEVKKHE